MLPVFSARCTCCKSPHRKDIDQRLLGGESTRSISRWLTTIGEPLSHAAVASHKKEHLAVSYQVAERALEAEGVFEEAIQRGVDRIAALGRNLSLAAEMRDLAAKAMRSQMENNVPPSGSLVGLFGAAASEVRQSIQAVQKSLGELPPEEQPSSGVNLALLSDEQLEALDELHSAIQGAADAAGGTGRKGAACSGTKPRKRRARGK